MAKTLTDNLTSRYFNAANKLRPGRKKQKIIAYVESYDDIFFWRSVFSEYETDERTFEVVLPSRTKLSRGKKTAMMNRLGVNLGTSMIACVDADYDYLLQGKTQFSHQMLSNPYIFHTYTYAIENYQCYAPSLHNVCVMATLNDRQVFNFEAYLRSYSEIIYDLFVWSVWMYREEHYKDMPLTTFCNFIAVNHVNLYHPEKALEELRHVVNRKMAWMQKHYPQARGQIKPLKEELQTLGVRPDNTYLYIQGHHLLDNVVMQVLDPVCTLLRREREKEIKRLAGHTQQMDNELSSYMHSQCPIDQMVRRNTSFKQSEPYQRLKNDIEAFLQRIDNNGNTDKQKAETEDSQAVKLLTNEAEADKPF